MEQIECINKFHYLKHLTLYSEIQIDKVINFNLDNLITLDINFGFPIVGTKQDVKIQSKRLTELNAEQCNIIEIKHKETVKKLQLNDSIIYDLNFSSLEHLAIHGGVFVCDMDKDIYLYALKTCEITSTYIINVGKDYSDTLQINDVNRMDGDQVNIDMSDYYRVDVNKVYSCNEDDINIRSNHDGDEMNNNVYRASNQVDMINNYETYNNQICGDSSINKDIISRNTTNKSNNYINSTKYNSNNIIVITDNVLYNNIDHDDIISIMNNIITGNNTNNKYYNIKDTFNIVDANDTYNKPSSINKCKLYFIENNTINLKMPKL